MLLVLFLRVQQARKEGKNTQNPRTSQLCTEGNLLAVSLEAGVGLGFFGAYYASGVCAGW